MIRILFLKLTSIFHPVFSVTFRLDFDLAVFLIHETTQHFNVDISSAAGFSKKFTIVKMIMQPKYSLKTHCELEKAWAVKFNSFFSSDNSRFCSGKDVTFNYLPGHQGTNRWMCLRNFVEL